MNHQSYMASLKKIATTAKTKDLEPKAELYLEMVRISESGYCAGWAIDIEFFLWQAVLDSSKVKEFGARTITEQEIAHLKTLALAGGGWWYWSEESKKVTFIPLDAWQKIYQRFCER